MGKWSLRGVHDSYPTLHAARNIHLEHAGSKALDCDACIEIETCTVGKRACLVLDRGQLLLQDQ